MAATLKTIRAITQALDGRQATWDGVSLPIPYRVWIIASDTSAVKIGNGIDRYADLPVAFYMNSVDTIATQLPYKANQDDLSDLTDRVDTQTTDIDKRLIVDTIDPQSDIGVIGAHYLNSSTRRLFGPKSLSGWGTGTPIADSTPGTETDLGSFTDFEIGFTQASQP